MSEVTQIIAALEQGRSQAAEQLLPSVHEALDALAAHDPRKAELVKLRYFADLTLEEAAVTLGFPVRTAKRDWAYVKGEPARLAGHHRARGRARPRGPALPDRLG